MLIAKTITPDLNHESWLQTFGKVLQIANEDYGLVQSRRVHYADGTEVEWGLTDRRWVDRRWVTRPLDPGTARVIADGMRILYDPKGWLAKLL